MLKYFIPFCLVSLLFTGCNTEINASWRPKIQKNVEASKMNFLFLCVENPLKIANIEPSDSVSISEGEIIKKPNGEFYAIVNKRGDVYISILDKTGKVETFKFHSRKIPPPVALICDKFLDYGDFELEDLPKLTLDCRMHDFPFDVESKIVTFSMLRISSSGDKTTVSLGNTDLSAEKAQSFLAKVEKGDILVFKEITINDACFRNKVLNMITLDII